MTPYDHRQPGEWLTTVLILGAIAAAVIGILTPPEATWAKILCGLVTLVLVACSFVFGGLRVKVSKEEVLVAFGPGWIKRRIPLAQVEKAEEVRNRWWYGWGIRRVPGAWLWNISGLGAVEIHYKGGGRFRIGTDEPAALAAAIQDAKSGKSRPPKRRK